MACLINLDEFKSIGTHWRVSNVNGNNIIYFDSFEFKHIPKPIKRFIAKKYMITNFYRIHACNSIKFGFFALDLLIFLC